MGDGAFSGIGEYAQGIPILSNILGPLIRGQQFDAIMERIKKGEDEYDALQGPQFSNEKFRPDMFTASMYDRPEAAQYEIAQLPMGTREAQLEALRQIQDQGNGYAAAQNAADRNRAMMEANQMAKSRQDAALMNAQSRGVGGSGMEYALGQQGIQSAANRAQEGGLQAAQQAALQKMMAAQGYSQGLNSLRNQDQNLAQSNTDIINKFNMANTNARNAVKMGNTDIRNRAGLYNTGNINDASKYNINRGDVNANATANFGLNRQAGKTQLTRMGVDAMTGKSSQDYDRGNRTQAQVMSFLGGKMGGGKSGSSGMNNIDTGETEFDMSDWG